MNMSGVESPRKRYTGPHMRPHPKAWYSTELPWNFFSVPLREMMKAERKTDATVSTRLSNSRVTCSRARVTAVPKDAMPQREYEETLMVRKAMAPMREGSQREKEVEGSTKGRNHSSR
ncbi:unnamed protein product [Sphagnum tenellum]